MPRTPAEPPVGTGTARERLSELAETIGDKKLDPYVRLAHKWEDEI